MNTEKQERSILFVAGIFVGSNDTLISIELIILRSNKSLKLRGKRKFLSDFSFLFSIATMNSEKQERSILFVAGIFVGSKRSF